MAGERGKHRRVMAPLNEAARQRLWGFAGGDSEKKIDRPATEEIWPELADLGDFFYAEYRGDPVSGDDNRRKREIERLKDLISAARSDKEGRKIVAEVESAWRRVGDSKSKKRIVRSLRERGFDAGFCRTQWDETEGLPPVVHDYIDVICAGGERYIIDCNLAAEFEIARATPHYQELLRLLPEVMVGEGEILRELVALLCNAAAESLRSREMHLPPWRRGNYVQGKWFGPYRRSTGAGRSCNTRAAAEGEMLAMTENASHCRSFLAGRTERFEGCRKLVFGLEGCFL